MPLIPLSDLQDTRLDVYRDVKRQGVMRNGRYFIVEGVRTVERLLASRFETESLLLAEERVSHWEGRLPPELPVYVLPTALASQLIGFHLHVGVMACGLRRRTSSLEALLGLPERPSSFGEGWRAAHRDSGSPRMPGANIRETGAAEDGSPRHPAGGVAVKALPEKMLLVVCPNCDNPENLGAIIRIASAFRADGLLLGDACCDPFSRRVIRVSMGNIFQFAIRESRDLAVDLNRLRQEFGFETMGTVLSEAALPLKTIQRPRRLALLLGNEADGLTQEWLDLCDQLATIPMPPDVDSLNVAVAAGIFLHQFSE
jgi:tRNA G18 (ribose-2'-O)-methylase SpoU